MARKQETTVQYMNGSETIVKTNYHHGMHINHSMQVILIYIMHLPVIPTCLPLTHSIPKLFLALLSLCTGCPSIQYSIMACYLPLRFARMWTLDPCTQKSHTHTAAAGLAPELPTEIPGVGNLAFFRADDVQYFAKVLKEDEMELSAEEMKERKIIHFAKSQIRHMSLARGRCLTRFSPFSLSWNIPLRTRNVTCF